MFFLTQVKTVAFLYGIVYNEERLIIEKNDSILMNQR